MKILPETVTSIISRKIIYYIMNRVGKISNIDQRCSPGGGSWCWPRILIWECRVAKAAEAVKSHINGTSRTIVWFKVLSQPTNRPSNSAQVLRRRSLAILTLSAARSDTRSPPRGNAMDLLYYSHVWSKYIYLRTCCIMGMWKWTCAINSIA